MSTITPIKPWRPTKRDYAVQSLILLGSFLASYLVIAYTGFEGRLPLVLFFGIFAVIGLAIRAGRRRGKEAAKDAVMAGAAYTGIFALLLPVVSILWTVISRGTTAIYSGFFTTDMSQDPFSSSLEAGGIKHALIGTIWLIAIALIISVPLGILTALYLTEIKGPGSALIRFLVQAMSGIPSIVAGLFIYSALISGTGRGFSGFMGALALSILMIPTVARTSEEVLKLVPAEYREAGLALGATHWKTVALVVIPAAKSGLVTAVILGVARIAGETAPLLFTTGGADDTNLNPLNGNMGSIPFYIWKALIDGSPEAASRAWAGIFILMLAVLALFALARFLSRSKSVK
ncbi:MAG: phosphate ABC transporter permease PstA [Actinobacteria bacterium]|nr:phosphate ABC transporter permease PstA [Actinomycetota bacterium]